MDSVVSFFNFWSEAQGVSEEKAKPQSANADAAPSSPSPSPESAASPAPSTSSPPSEKKRPRIAVSACLLGEKVRHNSGHCRHAYITDILGQHFDFVPVCPEVGIGLGVPREPIRLLADDSKGVVALEDLEDLGFRLSNLRLFGRESGSDHTDAMHVYAKEKVAELRALQVDGYLLKNGSPTCGLQGVAIYRGAHDSSVRVGSTAGIYTMRLQSEWPELPLEEEGRLQDDVLRATFIVSVYCRFRWTQLRAQPLSLAALSNFHASHKFLLQAHSERHMRQLGPMLASHAGKSVEALTALYEAYERIFFAGIRCVPTRGSHRVILEHMAGYARRHADPPLADAERKQLTESIGDYYAGLVPLAVPLSLLRLFFARSGLSLKVAEQYVTGQPASLRLQSHVPSLKEHAGGNDESRYRRINARHKGHEKSKQGGKEDKEDD